MMDLIHSQSEKGLHLAANQVQGSFRVEVERLRQRVLDCLSRIELLIDYPDEDQAVLPEGGEIEETLIQPLRELIAAHNQRKIWIQGITTAIVGRVNAGKSSLLNRLLDEERALVSAVPGTTRDVIESTLYIQGLPLRLMDTAGFRRERGTLERKGIERTRERIEQAEFVLIIIDGSRPLGEVDRGVLAQTREKPALVVLNKIDLPSRVNRADLDEARAGLPLAKISALTGEGVEELRRTIRRLVLSGETTSPDHLMAPNMRQKQALEKACGNLVGASGNLERQMPLEIVAEDMKEALAALGEIGGETTSEEVLDRIFSQFCLGK
jgi:tRNA modification GTPase